MKTKKVLIDQFGTWTRDARRVFVAIVPAYATDEQIQAMIDKETSVDGKCSYQEAEWFDSPDDVEIEGDDSPYEARQASVEVDTTFVGEYQGEDLPVVDLTEEEN